jgi:HAD superfamily hydrolase (TIGR01450 family)
VAWLLDLDGVVWLAHRPIPGVAEGVAALRAAGERVLFVTNASMAPVGVLEEALAAMGIPAEGDVLSSAMAAAHLLEPGARALVCGGPGVVEALERRGVEVVEDGVVDAVVVGLTRDLTYDLLLRASTAVRDGARFIATNTDPTYPTPGGLTPGGGAIVAAVATAAGVEPEVAGKPHRPDGRARPCPGRRGTAHHGRGPGRHRPRLRPGARRPHRPRAVGHHDRRRPAHRPGARRGGGRRRRPRGRRAGRPP